MIDPKVFAELQNREIITVVGLDPSKFENIDELKNYGLATSIATDEVYNTAVEKFENSSSEDIVVDDNTNDIEGDTENMIPEQGNM